MNQEPVKVPTQQELEAGVTRENYTIEKAMERKARYMAMLALLYGVNSEQETPELS